MKRRKLRIVLAVMKNVLIFITGAALALTAQTQSGGIDGTVFILPLAVLLILLGWIWRGAVENTKK